MGRPRKDPKDVSASRSAVAKIRWEAYRRRKKEDAKAERQRRRAAAADLKQTRSQALTS
jgi:hypothetical protein